MRPWFRWLKVPLLLTFVGAVTFTLASTWVGTPPRWAEPVLADVNAEALPAPRAVALPDEAPAARPSHEDRRGVYLTANVAGHAARLSETIANSKAAGFNAIVIDVKDNSGTLAYGSKIPLAERIGSILPRYDLAELVETVHAHGLYFIARLVVFSDPKLSTHLGRPDEWVSPSNEVAVEYNLAVAEEAAAAGVDEIQFDYIRYPDDRDIGGGARYHERSAHVTRFLERAHGRLAERVHLSADVFGRTLWGWNAEAKDPVGQLLEHMSPFVDQLSPMIYPSHYEAYFRTRPYEVVKRSTGVGLERGLPLRPFLQAFDMRIPSGMSYTAYMRAQLRALRELGVDGYLWWNPSGDYGALWAALAGR